MIVEQKWEDCPAEAAEREFASLKEWCNFLEASLRKAGVEPDPGQAEAGLEECKAIIAALLPAWRAVKQR